MRIGLIVDHPKRDLPGAVRIAQAAATRGHSSVLIPLYEQALDVPLLGLDALVVNYARSTNLDLLRGYAAAGLPLLVLDTEGGILTEEGANSPEGLVHRIRDPAFASLISGYFFWGPRLREIFLNAKVLPKEQLIVTGCPRFDFAAQRWSEAIPYARHGYVLVNANFPLVNPRFSTSTAHERNTMISVGWEAGYVDRLIEEMKTLHGLYMDAVASLATQLPELEFLVRPHPFENAQIYLDRFSALPNIRVDGSGSVLNVIRASRCVVHLNCGTATEAIMMGKLPISLEFLNMPHLMNHSMLPSAISWRATSLQHAAEAIANIDQTAQNFDFNTVYAQHIHPWFFENDGAAGERVVAAIEQLIPSLSAHSSRTVGQQITQSLRASRHAPRLGQRAQALVANVVGSELAARLRAAWTPKRAEKALHQSEVARCLELLGQAANTCAPRVSHAKHPIHGVRLASLQITPE